jgi:hypothetical protein
MPYITPEDRKRFDKTVDELVVLLLEYPDHIEGNLNYVVTKIIKDIFRRLKDGVQLNYKNLNSIVGALECIKLEFYRRMIVPYEDIKKKHNGDV